MEATDEPLSSHCDPDGGHVDGAARRPTGVLQDEYDIVDIEAGEAHTMVLTASGHVFAWGRGMFGRLGLGADADKSIPTAVQLIASSRDDMDLAVTGTDSHEEVGQLSTTRIRDTSTAESLTQQKVLGIAAGAYHSLALTEDGSVWSWGYNAYCQLGGDGKHNSEPTRVLFDDHRGSTQQQDVQVARETAYSIAEKELEGDRLSGEEDRAGATSLEKQEEAQVTLDDNQLVVKACSSSTAVELSGSSHADHCCHDFGTDLGEEVETAFRGSRAGCSGQSDNAQSSLSEERVNREKDRIQKIVSEHSAPDSSTQVGDQSSALCGDNREIGGGPLSSGSGETSSPAAASLGKTKKSAVNIKTIAAGGFMSCAVDECGALWVWGNSPSSNGQAAANANLSESGDLGEGRKGLTCMMVRERPTRLSFFSERVVVMVACGQEHVLMLVNHSVSVSERQSPSREADALGVSSSRAVKHDTGQCFEGCSLYAWGGNQHGQLGVGDTESRSFPVMVSKLADKSAGTVRTFACGGNHSVVVTGGAVRGATVPSNSCSREFAEGSRVRHSSAAMNVSDDCSQGDSLEMGEDRVGPVEPVGDICWSFGLGENGQLGHGTTVSSPWPTPVRGLSQVEGRITAVGCGLFHTCVVVQERDVWVWGMEAGMGLCPGTGAGDFLEPVQIPNGLFHFDEVVKGRITSAACGAAHTVVVKQQRAWKSAGDELWAWGRGLNGVLGNGADDDYYRPCPVAWPPPSLAPEPGETPGSFVGGVEKEAQKPGMTGAGPHGDPAAKELVSENALLKAKVTELRKELAALSVGVYGETSGDSSVWLSDWLQRVRSVSDKELDRLVDFYGEMLRHAEEERLHRRVKRWMQEFMATAERPSSSLTQSLAMGSPDNRGRYSVPPTNRLNSWQGNIMGLIQDGGENESRESMDSRGDFAGASTVPRQGGVAVGEAFHQARESAFPGVPPTATDTIRCMTEPMGGMTIERGINSGARTEVSGYVSLLSADEKESLSWKMQKLQRF
ncbi:hypothetical protein CBR_g29831 [Chara braunii]|uniref:Uncharacterized protein n=1 Tax=Chara braunii TaxID=69332 RepID=A0A388JWS0_CHABU|nr:hypothetical protein CBR_g29831 [Chara braunii]|eukprot:GBG62223.1 hypothetical protein CBR_g29831 [Chara braunii]